MKSKEAAGLFNEILDSCECAMKEVVSEMDEFAYLFQEQDSEAETRRKTLSATFKRAKERNEGMSGSEAAPTRAPKPKAMPRDIKLKRDLKDVHPRWRTDEEPSKSTRKQAVFAAESPAIERKLQRYVGSGKADWSTGSTEIHYIGQIFCESFSRYYKDLDEGAGGKRFPGWSNHTIERCWNLQYMDPDSYPSYAKEKIREYKA